MNSTTVKGDSTTGNGLWQEFLASEKEISNRDGKAYECPWTKGIFTEVTEFSDMVKFEKHGAHAMIWCPAKDSDMMLDTYPLKYRIIMQVRFDGRFGFAGGFVDEMKDYDPAGKNFQDLLKELIKGLKREVQEEMGLKIETEPKYIYSSCFKNQLVQPIQNAKFIPGYVLHFFSCQVPLEVLESMEKNTLQILSSDEVLGITRVPLYFMNDNFRGLPSFLTNAFIGNALEQLMRACIEEGILTEQQVRFAYYVALKLLPKPGVQPAELLIQPFC